ncbi:hypothetical protein Xen7305DRAFT_00050110 [Xenococcus sp. PCC 7305]|nr:hypothetical protein Xen7305DRAFT_00050110 [Xenococcus sp. PCC 7305]
MFKAMQNTRVLFERITFNPQIMGGKACIRRGS